MSVLFAWVLLFVAVAIVAMPLLIYAIAWGFAGDQQKLNLSVGLARVAFPYLLFMSLAALLSGVLNSTHRFAAAAAAPISAQRDVDRSVAHGQCRGLGR